MPYPESLVARYHRVDDYVGLQFRTGNREGWAYFRVLSREAPNDLWDFSLGTASAQAVAGTGWSRIQDSSNKEWRVPDPDNVMYQGFYGITPSYARVYRQVMSGNDRGSLNPATRQIGDPVGFINGEMSPYRRPSFMTEFHTVRGMTHAFLGYHPYGEPASVTVRMNFFVATYGVENVSSLLTELQVTRLIETGQLKRYTVGGRTLVEAPTQLVR